MRPNEELLAGFASSAAVSSKDGKKDKAKEAKGKDPKGGAASALEEYPEPEEEEIITLNFSETVKYDLLPADAEINSNKVSVNIYLESLQLAIRFDIRYSQYCVIMQQKYELAVKLLQDTVKLMERTLYVSPQL